MQNIELANFSIVIRKTPYKELTEIHEDLYQLYIFFVWIHCELEVQQNSMTGINSCFESWMCYFENLGYLLMES